MRPHRPVPRAALPLAAALLALASPAAAAALPGGSATVQDRRGRPDQVLVRQHRGNGTSTVSGTVVEATLRQVVLETRDGERRELDADEVERIVLGDVPTEFADANTFFERGEFEDAAVQYRLAIDAAERGVVKAAARLGAARSLLRLGTRDPSRLQDAIAELDRFRSSYPEGYDLPEARRLSALAKWLAGDAAGAAAEYQALFDEAGAGSPTRGYSARLCYVAGARAAEAYLAAGDPASARAIHSTLAADLPGVLASLEPDDPDRLELMNVEAAARLGEGFALLAEGKSSRARAFFESQLSEDGADAMAALRFGARLGLGEALLAEDQPRAAMFELAQVSALDFTDEHRTARALLGLARGAVAMDDPGPFDPRVWLDAIRDEHATTPSGPEAAALRQSL